MFIPRNPFGSFTSCISICLLPIFQILQVYRIKTGNVIKFQLNCSWRPTKISIYYVCTYVVAVGECGIFTIVNFSFILKFIKMFSIAQTFKDLVILLFGKECGNRIADNLFDAIDISCMKIAFSRILSYGILFGGLFVKIPQILRILNQKTAFGMSIFALVLEILSLALSVAYNFRKMHPFESYGESLFLLIQTVLIVFLAFFLGTEEKTLSSSKESKANKTASVEKTQNNPQNASSKEPTSDAIQNSNGPMLEMKKRNILACPFFRTSLFVCLLALLYQLLINIATIDELALLVKYWAVPLFVLSRTNQIAANFMAKSTGALSPISCFLVAAGSLARVFTTFVGVNDPLMLFSTSLAAFLNTVVLAQIGLYALQ